MNHSRWVPRRSNIAQEDELLVQRACAAFENVTD